MSIIQMNTVLIGILNQKKQEYWVSEIPIIRVSDLGIQSTGKIDKLSIVKVIERTSVNDLSSIKVTGFNLDKISIKSIKKITSLNEPSIKVTGFSLDKLAIKSIKKSTELIEPSKLVISGNIKSISLWGQFNKGFNNINEDSLKVSGNITRISLKNR